MPKSKEVVPDNETKKQKFVRVGQKRLENALMKISALEGLGSANYEFTQSQADKIVSMLVARVTKVEEALKPKVAKVVASKSSISLADDNEGETEEEG